MGLCSSVWRAALLSTRVSISPGVASDKGRAEEEGTHVCWVADIYPSVSLVVY